eukprot:m.16016 g.16016  ORF g.16016 m.16016 type:complete len:309 (+) comp10880_c0_seq1:212-1138(+)
MASSQESLGLESRTPHSDQEGDTTSASALDEKQTKPMGNDANAAADKCDESSLAALSAASGTTDSETRGVDTMSFLAAVAEAAAPASCETSVSGKTVPSNVSAEDFTINETEDVDDDSGRPRKRRNVDANVRSGSNGSDTQYPCGKCGKACTDDQDGICCEHKCNRWFHRDCAGLTPLAYQALVMTDDALWACDDCLPQDQTLARTGSPASDTSMLSPPPVASGPTRAGGSAPSGGNAGPATASVAAQAALRTDGAVAVNDTRQAKEAESTPSAGVTAAVETPPTAATPQASATVVADAALLASLGAT